MTGLAVPKKKIKWNWLYFILLLPYTEPQSFKYNEVSDSIFAAAKLVAFVLIAILYLRQRPSKFIFAATAFQGWIFISTVVERGSVSTFLGPAISLISTIMVFEMALKENSIQFLKWIRNLLTLYALINVLTLFLSEIGISSISTFLGMDNRWLYFYLPWVVVTFVVSVYERGVPTVWAWLSWLFSTGMLVYTWSAGGMLAMLAWPFAWIFFFDQKNLLGKRITINRKVLYISIICILVINYLLVTGSILLSFKWLIVDTLHKDLTLSGRALLWRVTLDAAQKNPLFCTGQLDYDSTVQFFYVKSGFVPACAVNHPHDNFLYYLLHGGYPALILYSLLLFLSLKQIIDNFNVKTSCCIFVGIICFLIAGMVDSLDFPLMHMIFILGYNIKTLINIKLNSNYVSTI